MRQSKYRQDVYNNCEHCKKELGGKLGRGKTKQNLFPEYMV